MNMVKIGIISALIALASLGVSQLAHADQISDIKTSMSRRDDGDKAAIIANKAKIADERDAILAADKRLCNVRRTGDKARIEQVRREVEQEIRTRKDTIKNLKADIRKREGGAGSFEQGKRRRDKEAK